MSKERKQVQQSKKWIVNALLELMQEKPFNEITIKEISQQADLHRRTFYRHFSTKEDVLDHKIAQMISEYTPHLLNTSDLTGPKIIQLHFEFLEEHIDFLKLLKKDNLFGYLLSKYNHYGPIIYEKITPNSSDSVEETSFMSIFKTGGFWNIVSYWVEQEKRQKPGEMAKLMAKFII